MYNESMLLRDLVRAYREKDKQAVREISARLAALREPARKSQLTSNARRPVQKGI